MRTATGARLLQWTRLIRSTRATMGRTGVANGGHHAGMTPPLDASCRSSSSVAVWKTSATRRLLRLYAGVARGRDGGRRHWKPSAIGSKLTMALRRPGKRNTRCSQRPGPTRRSVSSPRCFTGAGANAPGTNQPHRTVSRHGWSSDGEPCRRTPQQADQRCGTEDEELVQTNPGSTVTMSSWQTIADDRLHRPPGCLHSCRILCFLEVVGRSRPMHSPDHHYSRKTP